MNGVDYIKSLGDDTANSFNELKKIATQKNKTHCIYAISLNGESLHEGKGLINRAGLIYFKPGETPINHCSAFIVVTSILLKSSQCKIDYAVKLVDSASEASLLEREMHQSSKFNDRLKKADIALNLAFRFCKEKNLSKEATTVVRLFSISNYNFFKEVKEGRNHRTIDDFVFRELQDAFGFEF